MVIGKKVAFLGFVVSVIYEDKAGKLQKRGWPGANASNNRNQLALCSNARGSALYFLPFGTTTKPAELPAGANKEKALFEKWSGFEADSAFKITVRNDTLFLCGRLIEIQYDSDKWEGYLTRYVHTYDNPPKFYNDKPRKPKSWGVLHEKGRKLVSARGLIG